MRIKESKERKGFLKKMRRAIFLKIAVFIVVLIIKQAKNLVTRVTCLSRQKAGFSP